MTSNAELLSVGKSIGRAAGLFAKDTLTAINRTKYYALIGTGIGGAYGAASGYYNTGRFDPRATLRGAMWGTAAGGLGVAGMAAWRSPYAGLMGRTLLSAGDSANIWARQTARGYYPGILRGVRRANRAAYGAGRDVYDWAAAGYQTARGRATTAVDAAYARTRRSTALARITPMVPSNM